MAHGEADYTKTTVARAVYAKIDFDLPILLVDRFDSANFLWAGGGVPVDYDCLMEAGAAYEGDAGMALRTSLAAVGVGEWANATRHLFTTPPRKLSMSILFRPEGLPVDIETLRFRITGRASGMLFQGAVQYHPTTFLWEYEDAALVYQPLIAGIRNYGPEWHRVYLELDLVNMQYIRFKVSDQNVPMRDIPMWTNAVAGTEALTVTVYLENRIIGSRAEVSVDDVIVKELG